MFTDYDIADEVGAFGQSSRPYQLDFRDKNADDKVAEDNNIIDQL